MIIDYIIWQYMPVTIYVCFDYIESYRPRNFQGVRVWGPTADRTPVIFLMMSQNIITLILCRTYLL